VWPAGLQTKLGPSKCKPAEARPDLVLLVKVEMLDIDKLKRKFVSL
jgi:hypothetical protein